MAGVWRRRSGFSNAQIDVTETDEDKEANIEEPDSDSAIIGSENLTDDDDTEEKPLKPSPDADTTFIFTNPPGLKTGASAIRESQQRKAWHGLFGDCVISIEKLQDEEIEDIIIKSSVTETISQMIKETEFNMDILAQSEETVLIDETDNGADLNEPTEDAAEMDESIDDGSVLDETSEDGSDQDQTTEDDSDLDQTTEDDDSGELHDENMNDPRVQEELPRRIIKELEPPKCHYMQRVLKKLIGPMVEKTYIVKKKKDDNDDDCVIEMEVKGREGFGKT